MKFTCQIRTAADKRCATDLTAANETVDKRDTEIAALKTQLKTATGMYGDLLNKSGEMTRVISLMEKGPGDPIHPMRVLPQQIMAQFLAETFGETYNKCQTRMISDADWLVSHDHDAKVYLDYYSMFWLPKTQPYTILTVTMLDGTEVRIWARDCDDDSDCLQGIPTLHMPWTALPWGIFWGDVKGWITGGHAFNWIITRDDTYDETSTKGLWMRLIEPQFRGHGWTVQGPAGRVTIRTVDRLVSQPAALYTIEDMWALKV